MNPTSRLLALLALAVLPAVTAGCATTGHDLYLFGAVNIQGRVAGSRDTSLNGMYLRQADGSFRHVGVNYPAMLGGSFDPRDPRVCYVAALSGVLVTRDGGQSWRIGTSWDITEPKGVMVDPNAPDTIYAALPDGIGFSPDRGQTWTRRENGLPARGKYTQVVTVDRTRAGRVLAGCEIGIYLTEDAGQSWRAVHPTKETVNDLQQSPHDPKFWLAATQSAGVLASRDGGLTWKPVAGLSSEKSHYNIAFDPKNPQRIALGGWTYGLLVSEDGGATWTTRNDGLPTKHRVWRTAIDPDTGRLYAAVVYDSLYVSDDFGRTWQAAGLPNSRISGFAFVPKAQP
jgi:photosystem II stability/assembly factor-like uncharacterized protein